MSFHFCTLPLLCIEKKIGIESKLFPTNMTDTASHTKSYRPSAKYLQYGLYIYNKKVSELMNDTNWVKLFLANMTDTA